MALSKEIHQQPLTQVGVWTIGEFGDLLVGHKQTEEGETLIVSETNVVDLAEIILRSNTTTDITKEYTLTALIKLTDRFKGVGVEKIQKLIFSYGTHIHPELQQRAVEYDVLLKLNNTTRASLLERVPAPEIGSVTSVATPTEGIVSPPQKENTLISIPDILNLPNQPTINQPQVPGSILEILIATPTTPVIVPQTNGISILDTPMSTVLTPTTPTLVAGGGFSIPAFNKDGVTIVLDVSKQPNAPQVAQITANITNSNPHPLHDLVFQAAVPKYCKLQMNPPSSTTIPPNNSGKVTQQLKVANSLQGQKPIMLKLRVEYKTEDKTIAEMAEVANFPDTY